MTTPTKAAKASRERYVMAFVVRAPAVCAAPGSLRWMVTMPRPCCRREEVRPTSRVEGGAQKHGGGFPVSSRVSPKAPGSRVLIDAYAGLLG